ncbi:hypothetical protein ABT247_25880 [Kitasatospora sp. NPDC001539]|uniref:hypothetical protein n=1 Tax=Kitasatospora sp. NPDC001539 TaxID=3154384 RepID=UPI0033298C71
MAQNKVPRTVSAEEIVAAADSSGVFSSIAMEEVADDPRLVDIRFESPVGHAYLVMPREDLGEVRVLFENYVFDDVPAHRLLRFVELLERGGKSTSHSTNSGGNWSCRSLSPKGSGLIGAAPPTATFRTGRRVCSGADRPGGMPRSQEALRTGERTR